MACLILGDGKLATELVKQTGWDYISRKKDNFDFTDINSYKHMLLSYDIIINCIGQTQTYSTERQLNWDINYVGVIHLVNYCNEKSIKLIHISTDYIYANAKNNHSETDIPVHFESWYTYTKLLADGYVQAISKNYLLIRTNFKPRPFPWEHAWDNIRGNFDYVDVISNLIIKLINKGADGVYNVGTLSKTGAKNKSYYELALETNPLIQKDNTQKWDHPHDVTMKLDKLHKN